MVRRLLVDATHKEEMRVAVVDNNELIDFDYESALRKQLKGSIFLAKVTRVEPSLQAAFVNFGGNRHGFLPFSEIHPDYFRIPIADREALIEAQKEEMEAIAAEEEAEDSEDEDDEDDVTEDDADEDDTEEKPSDDQSFKVNHRRGRRNRGRAKRTRAVEIVGGDMAEGEQTVRPTLKKNYKIQEVVKRGQIMLVQAQKEERGNKGAAVTTYLSLPGRYCVLMPNSPRAGGVSRKIANFKERKRMREILKELNVPDGMSVILRTAGTERTKSEIKRDLDYLMRLWDDIRDLTLKSIAPACVYEEGDLVKRALRDIYTRDIEDVLVAGGDAYKTAKKQMKMLIPSHAKRVQEYTDKGVPLFQKYGVESQIAAISEPVVQLKSGGYIVINPTEALVAVDVNSGRATKERHIEETALRTNLESAEEVARQLKLRDLGGLVVIDFIDMEDRRNNGKVERKLKEALSSDRARIQIGRISNFGLLELSRQRLNPSVTESQFKLCEHCEGFGYTRTVDSAAVIAIRAIEEQAIKGKISSVKLRIPNEVALYILNHKRHLLTDVEKRHNVSVAIEVDEALAPANFEVETEGGKSDNNNQQNNNQKSNNNNNNDDNKKSSRSKRGRRGGRNRSDNSSDNENRDEKNNNNNKNRSDKNGHQKNNKPSKDDKSSDDKSDDNKSKKTRGRGKSASSKKSNDERTESVEDKKSDSKASDSNKDTSKDNKEDTKSGKKPVKKKTTADKDTSSKKDDKDEEKKPKKTASKSKSKSSEKTDKSKKPANDEKKKAEKKENSPKDDTPKDYEVVNKAPEKKKKGWWSK